ncbi:unnamed protein product [Gongylonema pulchrum]|uniref:Reverse transcriptase domain-containing protein n=1 Tax=Gongylonema pulchrum TaxID=637853 RepID=A0A183E4V5_9BILA|nr:unnamed protein product [Gongylonema pulchrum]
MNRTLANMLAKNTPVPMEWDCKLPFVLHSYNTTPQDSTGENPYFLLYGIDPIWRECGAQYIIDLDDYRTELLLGLQDIRSRALEHIKKEQERAKRYYDERSRVKAEQFHVGERYWYTCR